MKALAYMKFTEQTVYMVMIDTINTTINAK